MAGRVIPRPASEVGERGERVVVGEGAENPMMERMIRKRWPAAALVGVSLTGKKWTTRSVSVAVRRDINPSTALIRSAACVVVKAIRLSEVCANVVTVLACENPKSSNDESDAAISGEEEAAFICDMSGEYDDESIDEGACSALAWQVGDLTVICDSGASCHISHSATGMLNYLESIFTCGRRADRDTRSRVMATYHSPFDLVLSLYLYCFVT